MKPLLLLSLLLVTLFAACDKHSEKVQDSNNNIKEEPCETSGKNSVFNENTIFTVGAECVKIIYQGRIGHDFNSALDSLKRKYEPVLEGLEAEGHYSGEGYDIEQTVLDVDYNCDDRTFKRLDFTDKANKYNLLFHWDVLDDRGNHFLHVVTCED